MVNPEMVSIVYLDSSKHSKGFIDDYLTDKHVRSYLKTAPDFWVIQFDGENLLQTMQFRLDGDKIVKTVHHRDGLCCDKECDCKLYMKEKSREFIHPGFYHAIRGEEVPVYLGVNPQEWTNHEGDLNYVKYKRWRELSQ